MAESRKASQAVGRPQVIPMGISRWLLVGLGVAVVGVTVAYAMTEPLLSRGDGVVLVGDSLAVGLGEMAAYQGQSALKAELQRHEVSLQTLGKGATTSLQWSGTGHLNTGRLQPALRRRPRAVLVVLGTNDCHYDFGHCPPFRERILAIAQSIADAGAVPVLVAMPEMPWEQEHAGRARMQSARSAMKRAARESGGIYVEAPGMPIKRWPDQLHPDPEGNRVWAAYIMSVLGRARRWK